MEFKHSKKETTSPREGAKKVIRYVSTWTGPDGRKVKKIYSSEEKRKSGDESVKKKAEARAKAKAEKAAAKANQTAPQEIPRAPVAEKKPEGE